MAYEIQAEMHVINKGHISKCRWQCVKTSQKCIQIKLKFCDELRRKGHSLVLE